MSTKISSLSLTNFQKVSYAKIVPSGSLIVLAGKNGAGKTTTTEAIEAVLCGHDKRVIRRPIKDGAHKGGIEIELTDGSSGLRGYTAAGGTTLKFFDKDGQKTGQTELNKRISSLGLDGRRFMDMGEKDQLKELLSIVELPFVPAVLDAARKKIFDERTSVSRDVKRLEAQAAGFLAFPVDHPTEEVSVTDLLAEHRAAQELGRAQSDDHQERARANAEINRINAEIGRLIQMRSAAEADADNADARIAAHAPLPDIDDIQLAIDNAEATNAAARAYKAAQAVNAELATTQAEADTLTAKLAEIDQRKADGLAAAEMPVDGLSFDEEGVLYQGVPFSRAAGAEKGIVSIAMIIATNPDIRVIVFRDGNVFDMESLQIVQEMAEDNDFQIFIEIVADEAGDHEYYFVDGELAA